MSTNVFLNLPVPTSNSAGAAVDTSTLAASKTIIVGGSFAATVTIEYSTAPSGNLWAPVPGGSFQGAGRVTLPLAVRRMRAVTSNYVSGAPNADVGAPFAVAGFVQLTGVAADISALPAFKTVTVSGSCIVEVSEDGVSYSQVFAFGQAGAQSAVITGQFARVTGGVTCWMGGADMGTDSGGPTLSDAAPATISDTTNAAGVAVSASRGDHQHAHGSRGGGALHALFTSLSAGFLQFNVVNPSPVRALDVAFQPNATRPTFAIYSVDISCTLAGPVGAGGAIQLLSDSANPPTTIRDEVFLSMGGNIGLAEEVTNTSELVLMYAVPEGDFVMLATVPTAGGPSFAFDFATEITL